jgi:thiol:disulfide interchange protein
MKKLITLTPILLYAALSLAVAAEAQTKVATSQVKKTQGSAQSLQAAPAPIQPQTAQSSAGIKFFEGTWASAVSKAKLENKAIFVDAYASWCGPCKYMKKTIFTMPEVGTFYNKNFVNLAIDWEKAEARPLHNKYPLRAFPTLLFFNPATEQVVAVAEGALDGSNMIAFGNYGLSMLNKDNQPTPPTESSPAPLAPVAPAPTVPAKKTPQKKEGIIDRILNWFK